MVNQFLSELKTLFKYKDLIWQIAIKDLAVQYRYPLLGILWIFLMPFFLIIIFIIIFSRLLKINVPGYPYPVFFVTGILPWNYFASSVSSATTRISDSGGLVKNVYFPREIIPISIVLSNLINFIIALLAMFAIFTFFNIRYSGLIFLLPFVIFLEIVLISGVSFIVSSLQVKYRDIRYVVELFIMIIFYLTPIFYPIDIVKGMSEGFFKIYLINPFVGMITLYRIIFLKGYIDILNSNNINLLYILLLYPVFCAVLVFIIGLLIFKKLEPNFSDYL